MTLGSRLDLAALVVGTGLLCVLVAEVYLNARKKIVEALQPILHGRPYPLVQRDATGDVMAVDLNMHAATPD